MRAPARRIVAPGNFTQQQTAGDIPDPNRLAQARNPPKPDGFTVCRCPPSSPEHLKTDPDSALCARGVFLPVANFQPLSDQSHETRFTRLFNAGLTGCSAENFLSSTSLAQWYSLAEGVADVKLCNAAPADAAFLRGP